MLALLSLHCDPRALVPVLNLSPLEQQLLVDILTQLMPRHPPIFINNEQNIHERPKLYLRGGELNTNFQIVSPPTTLSNPLYYYYPEFRGRVRDFKDICD